VVFDDTGGHRAEYAATVRGPYDIYLLYVLRRHAHP
jgi:hypothetical protein